MASPVRLSNWMTNVKIPRHVRDSLPLIVAGDRIAWVAGFRIGQPFLVTAATRRVLKMSFRQSTGEETR
jgi:tRNA(Ile)-lysidine synthase